MAASYEYLMICSASHIKSICARCSPYNKYKSAMKYLLRYYVHNTHDRVTYPRETRYYMCILIINQLPYFYM